MVMVRAARAGGPLRFFPSSCLRSSRQSSSAVAILTEHDTDRTGHSKEPGGKDLAQNSRTELFGSFLKEQRRFFNEFLFHLKDQRVLLDSIREELGLQKTDSDFRKVSINKIASLSDDLSSFLLECNTRKDVAMKAESTPSSMSAERSEQPETDFKQVSSVAFESTSGNDAPIVLSEEKGTSGGSQARKEAETNSFQHPLWPEWTTFLNNLRPYTSMEEPKEVFELFEDTTILKRAIVKFAQAHEDTFRSLSRKDLLVLVQHEFPSMDEKTAGGKKKLQDYLKADKSYPSRRWNNRVPQAKLTDVVRLVYRAIRSMPALGGALPSDLNSAVIQILQDLNFASIAQHNSGISNPENVTAHTKQIAQDMNQKIEADEGKISGDISRTVHGEALPLHERIDSIEQQSDSTLKTRMALSSLGLPIYGSLKERVDARRERLARESLEKEAAKAQLTESFLTKELSLSVVKKSSIKVEKSKVDCVVSRNFDALDAIIESDGCERSKASQKPVNGASEFRSAQT